MKKVLVIILGCLLCGCTSSKENREYKYSKDPMLESAFLEKEFVIIDVRTKNEYKKSHIKGAINISYDELKEKIDISKDVNIFVYCQSGQRSAIAYETLTNMGYTVYDLGAYAEIELEKE